MATKMEFKKGDGRTHYFKIPASSWSAAGTLWFTAKPAIDGDATDAAAVIDKSFTDSVVTDETINGVAYKKYTLAFTAADTSDISFADGAKKKKYLGEFQFVPITGSPSSFPDTDNFIEVLVYADIKRATT